jgi:epoxyqueuosine reductase
MDKAWAVRAGIGWLGKHTNVINRELGSWIFLANIICNYEFEYSAPIPDFCGSCTACIEACPTNAIVDEYVVDSNKCISYLTIENKNEIPDEFKGQFDNWIFGCDICQDVCPWNLKFTELTHIKDFHPQQKEISLEEVIEMTEEEFKKRFQTSPVKRAKLTGLKRNAEFLKTDK